jgi:hypothetical protein
MHNASEFQAAQRLITIFVLQMFATCRALLELLGGMRLMRDLALDAQEALGVLEDWCLEWPQDEAIDRERSSRRPRERECTPLISRPQTKRTRSPRAVRRRARVQLTLALADGPSSDEPPGALDRGAS